MAKAKKVEEDARDEPTRTIVLDVPIETWIYFCADCMSQNMSPRKEASERLRQVLDDLTRDIRDNIDKLNSVA